MMFEGQYNPTTFNLAFFMHNLFREEIERETQELELEKTTAFPVVAAPAPAPPRTQAPSFGQSGGAAARETVAREDTAVGRERQGMEAEPADTMLIAAGVGGLIVLGGLGYMLFGRAPRHLPRHRRSAFGGTVRHRPATAGPTPEEIQAQIQKIVDDKIKSSSAQYEDQLKTLQKQLDDAKKAQEQRAAVAANPAPRPATIPQVAPPPARATAGAPAPVAATPAESTVAPAPTEAEPKPAPPAATTVAAPVQPAVDGTVRSATWSRWAPA